MISSYINFQKKLIIPELEKNNYRNLLYLFFLLMLSVLINFSVRFYEKNLWDKNPSIFYAEGEPLLRSGDPAYFVNIAKYLKNGLEISDYLEKLTYPTITDDEEFVTEPPLISQAISFLSKDSSLEELVKASNKIILVSSIITCLGVFLLFYSIGRPFEGVIASLGGGIYSNYLSRSSIGYVDTDILNLFFMYALFATIYLSSKNQSLQRSFIFSVLAGLLGKLFFLWYPKPELILMSFFSLVFFTTFNTKNWKIVLSNSIIYILLTGPSIYTNILYIFLNNPYLSGYLSANIDSIDLVNKTSLNFNNIYKYIAEQTSLPFIELLKLEGSFILGLICFSGLFIWAITYPILFIGFAPLSLFFLLSMILGQRALFYSGPFLWFGLAYFISFISFKYIKYKNIIISQNKTYFISTFLLIIFSILVTNAFTKKIELTYIPNDVQKGLVNLKDLVKDKNNSIIVTDWTYGYQSLLYNDMPLLISPAIPASPRHFFIARAYTAQSLDETNKILNWVSGGNAEKLENTNITSFRQLSKNIYNAEEIDKDIYIVLTQQQKNWIRNTAATSYWDIENNRPYLFDGKSAFYSFYLMRLHCDALDTNTLTTMCADSDADFFSKDEVSIDIPVNLSLGLFNGEPVLKRVVQITDGKIEINQEYKNSKGNSVFQIVKNSQDNTRQLYLMHEAVFNSTYNKLLHLNENEDYELVYDDYPFIKVYKIN